MKYETKARPITTAAELEAALAAGAQVEFTSLKNTGAQNEYDAPRHPHNGSGGWIEVTDDVVHPELARRLLERGRLRAFSPVRRPLLSRLAFWRKAA
jgi:hypothetical protein